MAIGDCFAVLMGTSLEDRQPASGVFEEISSIVKNEATDAVSMRSGATSLFILRAAIRTFNDMIDAEQAASQMYNMALKIGNAAFLRKEGTTNVIVVSGVQVDA